MNSIIKFFLLLLLSAQLFSTEMTIIIPEEYKSSEPPLPPFPTEVLNNLPVNDYTQGLLDFDLNTIGQESIDYNYYPEVLNLYTPKGYKLKTTGYVGITDNFTSTLNGTLSSNNYLLSIVGSNELTLNSISYKDYHLPFTIGGEIIPFDQKLNLSFSFKNYSHSLEIDSSIKPSTLNGSITYLGNSFLYNYIDLSYNEDISGIISSGQRYKTGYFLVGVSRYETLLQPYIDFKLGSRYNLEFETIEKEGMDYQFLLGYSNYISIGAGYNFDYDLTPLDPFIAIKSSYKGDKRVVIRKDSIESDLDFYFNDIFINLVFNYENSRIYSSGELLYKNWSYGLIWDDYDIFVKLGYEVVL